MLDLPYYRLELDDYAAAAFTSFSKEYFGTLDDIRGLITALEQDEELRKSQQSLISAFHSYEQGSTDIQHDVAYQEVPLLAQATRMHQEIREYQNLSWKHLNTWQWPYYLRCEEAKAVHIWLKCQKQYYRCVKVCFRNLEYRGSSEHEWKPLGDMLWGFPEMIVWQAPLLWNRLAVIEKRFDNLSEVQADIIAFMNCPDPEFARFCDDIFGDG